MTTVADIAAWMQVIAPLELSEPWDNTGLLLGDPAVRVTRVLTCLTLTPESVAEAIEERVGLVIAHHPLPFKPLSQITTQSAVGRLLWQLAREGISVYSPHTAWDSALGGINDLLAEMLAVVDPRPIVPAPAPELAPLGAGRIGDLARPCSVRGIAEALGLKIPEARLRGVKVDKEVSRVAVACGSGASLLGAAIDAGCDLFVTGEATFHHCLEAEAQDVSLLLIGHYASERFAMRALADRLTAEMPDVSCSASKMEHDPVISLADGDPLG